MTRMTGPDCAVMCNFINTHTFEHTHTHKNTGSGRAKERRRSARNCTRVVDAMWETGGTWMERRKKT